VGVPPSIVNRGVGRCKSSRPRRASRTDPAEWMSSEPLGTLCTFECRQYAGKQPADPHLQWPGSDSTEAGHGLPSADVEFR
jgi:hypothetical protein